MGLFQTIGSAIGSIFKRKEGGTVVGNFIRAGVNNITNGTFGTGAMMLQPSETPEQANLRYLSSLGEAAKQFNDAAMVRGQYYDSPSNALQSGVQTNVLSRFLPYIVIGIMAVVGLILLLNKKRY